VLGSSWQGRLFVTRYDEPRRHHLPAASTLLRAPDILGGAWYSFFPCFFSALCLPHACRGRRARPTAALTGDAGRNWSRAARSAEAASLSPPPPFLQALRQAGVSAPARPLLVREQFAPSAYAEKAQRLRHPAGRVLGLATPRTRACRGAIGACAAPVVARPRGSPRRPPLPMPPRA
jgi:hypothetical protein